MNGVMVSATASVLAVLVRIFLFSHFFRFISLPFVDFRQAVFRAGALALPTGRLSAVTSI